MAHQEQFDFVNSVKDSFPDLFKKKRILDIGSLNINGSVRELFEDCEYIGVDLDYGPGVDLVCAGQDLRFRDNYFDMSVSCECFEHNPHWEETFQNMICMSKTMVIITCATEGRPEHGTARTSAGDSPFNANWNYYKNLTIEDFSNAVDLDSAFEWWLHKVNPKTNDLYFCGAVRG